MVQIDHLEDTVKGAATKKSFGDAQTYLYHQVPSRPTDRQIDR